MCIQGGTWLMQVTLGWLAWEMTQSALQVGLILGLRSGPLLLAPLTGVLADRLDRRKLLMVDHAAVTAVILGFAALLLLGWEQVWHLYAFAGLFGLGWAINNPVRQTLVATCVPRETLTNAFALISIANNAMRAIGPAIGGVLIVVFGPGVNFLIMGLLFLFVFLLIIPFRARYGSSDLSATRANSPLSNLMEGFRYVLSQPLTLITMAVTFTLSFAMMSLIYNLLSVYTGDVLGDEDGFLLGMLTASLGVGGFIGTMLMARFAYVSRKGLVASIAFTGATAFLLVLSQVSVFWMAVPVVIALQSCFQGVMTLNQTIIQTITPDAMRGRVTGVYQMEVGMTTLGGIIAGAIAGALGIQAAFIAGALAGLLVIGAVTVFTPSYRRMRF